jgi:hypothetical protein
LAKTRAAKTRNRDPYPLARVASKISGIFGFVLCGISVRGFRSSRAARRMRAIRASIGLAHPMSHWRLALKGGRVRIRPAPFKRRA